MTVFLDNLDLILSAAVLLISAVILARRGQISMLRELILSLVVGAEETYGSGNGALKKSDVAAKLYSQMPTVTKLLVGGPAVSALIEEGKAKMDTLE